MYKPHIGETERTSWHFFIVDRFVIPGMLWGGLLLIALAIGLRIVVGPSDTWAELLLGGLMFLVTWIIGHITKHGGLSKAA